MLKIARIPNDQVQALEMLAALSEQEAADFFRAVANAKPTIGGANFPTEAANALPNMQKSVVEQIMRVVLSMQAARITWDATAKDFVAALAAAENVVGAESLSGKAALWSARLLALLNIETAFLAVKAATTLNAQEHVFESAKIYTDIRPIFADQHAASDPIEPAAAVLVHSLYLRLGGESQPRELYVALDDRDLESLARVVDRAKKKAVTLAGIIETSKVRHLKPPQE